MYRLDVLSHGGGLPLFSAKPAVTFPAEECRRSSTSTKLYCFVTEAHRCEQLAQGRYAALSRWELNPRPIDRKSNALPLCHYDTTWGLLFTGPLCMKRAVFLQKVHTLQITDKRNIFSE